MSVAVIGLGIMGSRMAARLIGAGHRVRGFDPDAAALARLEAEGGTPAASPAEAVHGCWAALLSLPDSTVSRRVCLGDDGVAAAGVTPLLVLDTTTGWPDHAVEIGARFAEAGMDYADATVSGNAPIAERGELVVMVGSSEDAYRRAHPILDAISRSHHHVGAVGAGSRAKLIVNQVLGIHRMALAEALVVAEKAGLDLHRILELLRDGAAYSRAMDLWGERMIAGDHEPPDARLRQSHKDARLIVDHGRDLGATVDLSVVVRAAFAEGVEAGLGDLDNSAIAEVVRRRAGIGRIS